MRSLLLLLCAPSAVASLSDLRVEHLLAPMGVDAAAPRFSWQLDASSAKRGEGQASYHIMVTANPPAMQAKQVWDSGVVKSDKNYLIDYAGEALESDTNYTWSVAVVSAHGVTASASSSFRTGLFNRSDWGDAAWITGGDEKRVLRREFTLSTTPDPHNSMVYFSGIGYGEVMCNGAKLGDHELDIGWTDYSKRVLYTSFDLSGCLVKGKNVIGVTLGAGWFAHKTNYGGGQPGSHNAPPQLLLTARIRGTDGSLTTVNSAASAGPAPAPSPESGGTCGVQEEGTDVQLDCGASKIKAVTFASYGTLSTECPSPKATGCSADLTALVTKACVGQSKCSIECPPSSGSGGTHPHTCTASGASKETLVVNDPCYGTKKTVSVAVQCDATATCGVQEENTDVQLDCGANKIKAVTFASYGTLSTKCPSPKASGCSADLTALATKACVGQSKCSIQCPSLSGSGPTYPHTCTASGASKETLVVNDPCYDTPKTVSVAVQCDGTPAPTPTPPPTPRPESGDWLIAAGPIVYDSLYNGEHYNATMELGEWSTPGYDVSAWETAYTASTDSASSALLAYQLFEPIKKISTLTPKNITQPKPGMWVIDFGQNIAGWLRLTMRGQERGSVVTLKHAELKMHPPYGAVDGTLYYGNLRSAQATDTYVAKGGATETYEPTFTQHGFRYAEITGLSASTLEASDVVAIEVHTALEQTGKAEFESELFNQIQHNVAWGHKANSMSVSTDCPNRDERRGWTGDAALTAESLTYNFEPAAFYTSWTKQMRDDQASDGATANYVPSLGSSHGAPNWQSAFPTTIWSQYKYAGDLGLVKEQWNALKLYAQYWTGQINNTPDPTKFASGFGDWVPAGPKADTHLTGMFAAMHDMGLLAEMATAVGDEATASACTAARKKAGAAFHKQWYNADKGCYNKCAQAENAMALWIGTDVTTEDPNVTARVVEQTVSDIFDTHGGHTTTGIIGIKAMFEVMSRLGRADVPVRMSAVETYPSYGYMIKNQYEPATTLWELWNSDTQGPGMNSRNHIMFGSISSWFYRYLCGIDVPGRTGGSAYGYDEISIHPMGVGVVNSTNNAAKCAIKTPRGRAASSWRAPAVGPSGGQGSVELNATVPLGSRGTIRVPLVAAAGQSAGSTTITEGGKVVWRDGKYVPGVDGISAAKSDAGPGLEGEGVVFTVVSGSYAFQAAATPPSAYVLVQE